MSDLPSKKEMVNRHNLPLLQLKLQELWQADPKLFHFRPEIVTMMQSHPCVSQWERPEKQKVYPVGPALDLSGNDLPHPKTEVRNTQYKQDLALQC